MEDLIYFHIFSGDSSVLLFVLLVGFLSFTYILYALRSNQKNSRSLLPPSPPGLPVLGHLLMLGELPYRTLHRMSQKYGPVMGLRLGSVPAVVVSSPEAAELFLNVHDLNFASRPRIQAYELITYGNKGIAFSEYGPYWRDLRKLCTLHLLSISKIESFMCLRKLEIRDLIKHMIEEAKGRQVVNLSSQVGSAVERITHAMIFGKGYQEKYNFQELAQEAFELLGAFDVADYIPVFKPFDLQGLTRRMKKIRRSVDYSLEKIIHEQEPEKYSDFIAVMLSLLKPSKHHEGRVDRTTMKAIALDMLGAGMDTSITAINWALAEIIRNPEVLKRVHEELTSVVGLDRMVEEFDLPKLVYLNMVVKETLRLHPVAPLLAPHESIEGLIGGYHIPKRSRIIINAWAIGRDPNAWSDNAEEFIPERFNTNIDVRGHDIQLIPFGSGRRKCPGIELAMRTVPLVLAQVMHCFDLELPDGVSPKDIDIKEKFGLVVRRANPLLVVPTYRLHDIAVRLKRPSNCIIEYNSSSTKFQSVTSTSAIKIAPCFSK